MSDKKGNVGVIVAVVGVVAAAGIALYLLSRKSKKIDDTLIGNTTSGAPVISTTVGSTATPPYVDNSPKPIDWSSVINQVLGIGKTAAVGAAASVSSGVNEGTGDRASEGSGDVAHATFSNWVKG